MDTRDSAKSLKHERGQTDESLVSERGKTDESILDHRNKTEKSTNLKVKTYRQDADDVRTQHRLDTDANTVISRAANESNFPKNENQIRDELASDTRLLEQRNGEDAAVVAERLLMDAALVHERGVNNADANTFMHQERNATDKNLLRERVHTDSEVQRSSALLMVEQSSHSMTKAALTTREEFLAIVSHDLKNPIGTILSFAELLLEGFPQNEDDAKNWTRVIKRNAETSLRLISDMLDMERFSEGKLQLKISPNDINTLIRETIESFEHVAAERNIRLTGFPSKTIELMNFDRDRIGQVLSNLIGNALKFTPKGGFITVKAQIKNADFHISVTDTGPGIPEDQKSRIFERYAQLANKDRQGLGLGLYISKMLVEAHQGSLSVESTLGNGCTFSFSLPIK